MSIFGVPEGPQLQGRTARGPWTMYCGDGPHIRGWMSQEAMLPNGTKDHMWGGQAVPKAAKESAAAAVQYYNEHAEIKCPDDRPQWSGINGHQIPLHERPNIRGPYLTRLRVKRLRVGFKGFYSASVRRAPRFPLHANIAHVRACSWAAQGRVSASPHVRRGALGSAALSWPREPLSA